MDKHTKNEIKVRKNTDSFGTTYIVLFSCNSVHRETERKWRMTIEELEKKYTSAVEKADFWQYVAIKAILELAEVKGIADNDE